MEIVCLDLEGVLIPEIWVALADRKGIAGLRLTTREVADYDALMRHRLDLLAAHGLKLDDIHAAIAEMRPLDGAETFLARLREHFQVVILSDTFYEFAGPIMARLGWPMLMCHGLDVARDGSIVGVRLRMADQKRHAVVAFKRLNFTVLAAGDSYNDIGMLAAADAGILFRAPDNVASEFPHSPVVHDHDPLFETLVAEAARLAGRPPAAPWAGCRQR